jgi:hypothetical protein
MIVQHHCAGRMPALPGERIHNTKILSDFCCQISKKLEQNGVDKIELMIYNYIALLQYYNRMDTTILDRTRRGKCLDIVA